MKRIAVKNGRLAVLKPGTREVAVLSSNEIGPVDPVNPSGGTGSLPVTEVVVRQDPFFTIARANECLDSSEREFWAQWEDNGPDCLNKMLYMYVETLRYTLVVYHTNKLHPDISGSVVEEVEVVFNGVSTIYNSSNVSNFVNLVFAGDFRVGIQKMSDDFLDFLQMHVNWVRDINDVLVFGGGIGVVLKKVLAQNTEWRSETGPTINGFSAAGAFLGITRDDLELAASEGVGSRAWRKVVWPGPDFTPLQSVPTTCGPLMPRAWDPTPFDECPWTSSFNGMELADSSIFDIDNDTINTHEEIDNLIRNMQGLFEK